MTAPARVTAPAVVRPPIPTAEACVVVIFGASGDLTRRKLMPALYELQCLGGMSCDCQVIGTGRTPLSDEQFRLRMREAVAAGGHDVTDPRWRRFEQRLSYVAGDPWDASLHRRLAAELDARHRQGASANHLFYVATPASVARPIIEGLGAAGLARNAVGWSRIVLEKPFGRDLASARELNHVVNAVFPEEAVFRIDHYLGKETVQNLLFFRFGNAIFEPVWNRTYVDYVEITAAEALGVGSRGAFYEETGALRDMVANHLLQLLTLTAMEPPPAFDADTVRDAKVQLLRAIRPMSREEVARRTVRGQYGPGRTDGEPVRGYREERDVRPTSSTETFAAIEFHVDTWRWAGVPFYVRTGKRLAGKLTEIRVHFRRPPQALAPGASDARADTGAAPNQIVFRIQPDEGITIAFAAKHPGAELVPVIVQAEFSYAGTFAGGMPDAYATLLLDAMRGDATHFTRRDEIEAAWRIITPIADAWADDAAAPLHTYPAGSDGPPAATTLIHRHGHQWCAITPCAGAEDATSPPLAPLHPMAGRTGQ